MGRTVWGLNPSDGTRFSAPVQTGHEVHPPSCTMDTGFILMQLSDLGGELIAFLGEILIEYVT